MPLTLTLIAVLLAGCADWERQTFQTLTAAKAVIDQASNDYNAGVIPKTAQNYLLLTKAQQAKDFAVTAFKSYWDVKSAVEQELKSGSITGSGAQAKLAAARAGVTAALRDLAPLLGEVRALRGH